MPRQIFSCFAAASSRPQVAYCLVKQADAHWADREYEDVLLCYEEASAIFAAWSPNGADCAPILQLHSWCALASVALEDLEQALRWNQKARELVDAICGATSWERYRVLVDHARFLEFSVKQARLFLVLFRKLAPDAEAAHILIDAVRCATWCVVPSCRTAIADATRVPM